MRTTVLIILSLMLNLYASAQEKLTVKGVMPAPDLKVGTWTDYTVIKSEKGTDILKYRVRLKSAKKFFSGSAECTYEIEATNLTKDYISADVTYDFDQELNGDYKSQSGSRRGFIKGGSKWKYELLAFHDIEKGGSYQSGCNSCKLSFNFIINIK